MLLLRLKWRSRWQCASWRVEGKETLLLYICWARLFLTRILRITAHNFTGMQSDQDSKSSRARRLDRSLGLAISFHSDNFVYCAGFFKKPFFFNLMVLVIMIKLCTSELEVRKVWKEWILFKMYLYFEVASLVICCRPTSSHELTPSRR